MPRYFFDIDDAHASRTVTADDGSGVELADEAAARAHALMVLGGFVLPPASPTLHATVACRGAAGEPLFTVAFADGRRAD